MSANWSADLHGMMGRRRNEGWLERFQSAFNSVEEALGHAVDALNDAIDAAREVRSNWYRLQEIWYELPTRHDIREIQESPEEIPERSESFDYEVTVTEIDQQGFFEFPNPEPE